MADEGTRLRDLLTRKWAQQGPVDEASTPQDPRAAAVQKYLEEQGNLDSQMTTLDPDLHSALAAQARDFPRGETTPNEELPSQGLSPEQELSELLRERPIPRMR